MRLHYGKIKNKTMNHKSLAQLHELHSPKNVELGDTMSVLEKLNELDLTQLDVAEVIKEVYRNIFFFTDEVGQSGMTLTNFLSYAVDAKYVDENEWKGSMNRNRITREYMKIISQ